LKDTETAENWYSRGKAEADKGIPDSERIVGVGIVVFCAMMMIYFVVHQMRSTGFFTEKFGAWEMIMFYGSWVFWIVTASLEGILGQRLLSRLWDTFGGLIFAAIATVWLLVVFPFEFSYIADVLPDSLRFTIRWISNDIARVGLVIAIILYIGAAVYAPVAYGFVGNKFTKSEE
jgi:hypothetical protein